MIHAKKSSESPSINRINVLIAISRRFAKATSQIKGINLSLFPEEMVTISDLSSIKAYNRSNQTIRNVMLQIDQDHISLEIGPEYDGKPEQFKPVYDYMVKIILFKFEYIVYPKFLMRNSSVVSYNLAKYSYLNSVMKEVLGETNESDASFVL